MLLDLRLVSCPFCFCFEKRCSTSRLCTSTSKANSVRARVRPWPEKRRKPRCSFKSANRVSGSSETKTYGKSAAVRAHEKQQTLPRRSFFGKDTTERLHIFNVLQTRFSPTEALFSGKLSYTDIARGCRASL